MIGYPFMFLVMAFIIGNITMYLGFELGDIYDRYKAKQKARKATENQRTD